VLRSRIERNLEDANRIIVAYGGQPLEANAIIDETRRWLSVSRRSSVTPVIS